MFAILKYLKLLVGILYMRYTRAQPLYIVSYFSKLDRVMQTLLKKILHMFIHKVLCWEEIHDGLGGIVADTRISMLLTERDFLKEF